MTYIHHVCYTTYIYIHTTKQNNLSKHSLNKEILFIYNNSCLYSPAVGMHLRPYGITSYMEALPRFNESEVTNAPA